jgi:hypothetical protein
MSYQLSAIRYPHKRQETGDRRQEIFDPVPCLLFLVPCPFFWFYRA